MALLLVVMWSMIDALREANSRSIAIGENSVDPPAEASRQLALSSGKLFEGTSDNPVLDFGGSTEMGAEAVVGTSGSNESESGAPLGMLAMLFVLEFLALCSFAGIYRSSVLDRFYFVVVSADRD
jgi:hypothetical protein